jgi:hypothetical protein
LAHMGSHCSFQKDLLKVIAHRPHTFCVITDGTVAQPNSSCSVKP